MSEHPVDLRGLIGREDTKNRTIVGYSAFNVCVLDRDGFISWHDLLTLRIKTRPPVKEGKPRT
jgi:hypothetical protein